MPRPETSSGNPHCPHCGCFSSTTKDSRFHEDANARKRRRVCTGCGFTFTTWEITQEQLDILGADTIVLNGIVDLLNQRKKR